MARNTILSALLVVPMLVGLFAPQSDSRGMYSRTRSADYLNDISEEGIYNWPVDMLPIKVYIQPGDGVSGYRSNYPEVLRSCFDEWVAAAGNRIAWEEVSSPAAANLVVSFSADAPEREGGTEAGRTRTFTRYNTDTNRGVIYKATMKLATRLPDRLLSDAEIKKTFLHEVGHAFGLAGHSPERTDIMCAKVNVSQVPVLSERDRSTISRLYGDYPRRDRVARQPLRSREGT